MTKPWLWLVLLIGCGGLPPAPPPAPEPTPAVCSNDFRACDARSVGCLYHALTPRELRACLVAQLMCAAAQSIPCVDQTIFEAYADIRLCELDALDEWVACTARHLDQCLQTRDTAMWECTP